MVASVSGLRAILAVTTKSRVRTASLNVFKLLPYHSGRAGITIQVGVPKGSVFECRSQDHFSGKNALVFEYILW